jgi:hypothetical protein
MNTTLRNVLAFIAGVIALGLGKYVATTLGNAVIPPPAGVDISSLDSFKASLPLFEARHWIPAFFEHAVGSLLGGFVAARLAASHTMKLALGVGAFHMLGGIAAAALLPFPVWVVALDLTVMYLPMAWLGGRFGSRDGVAKAAA